MPGRESPLITDQIYHVINRGISLQPVFVGKRDYQRAIQTLFYYQNREPQVKYSRFITLSNEIRQEIFKTMKREKNFLAEVLAYCLMPNHFHFLLKQTTNEGISKFMSNFTNSFTRYFNTKNGRKGPLFQGKFKAVRINSDEQLLHVSRYIHLNPYSSYLVKDISQLENYPFSSLPEYLDESLNEFCDKNLILGQFKNRKKYKDFVFDQANYQKELETIKHLLLEESS